MQLEFNSQDEVECAMKPAILVINSQVIRGAVGGRGSVFVLERLGFPVWFLPTVLLPWHPGHGKATRITTSPENFQNLAQDLIDSGKLNEIGGILTGYLGESSQADVIAKIVGAVKAANPDAIYLCDPVMGDDNNNGGGLYVSENVAAAVRDVLVPLADIITPNLFELAWLAGKTFKSDLDCIDSRKKIETGKVIVTSVPADDGKKIANLLMEGDEAVVAAHELLEGVPHGTGDLLASLTLAGYLSGSSGKSLLRRITSSVCDAVKFSAPRKFDESALLQTQNCKKSPESSVDIQPVPVK